MDINKIQKRVNGIPNMTFPIAKAVTEIIKDKNYNNILELGFNHGVSTCYLAAAIDEIGGGKITTIDRTRAKSITPNIEELLADLELSMYVKIYYEPTSYLWRLMKILEVDATPKYNFCYIDGGHNWFDTGYAFYLVDKLLVPGGLILFDDLDWTYNISPTQKDKAYVKRKPEEERVTPQVRKVYELLVKTHPSYHQFVEKKGQGYAYKKLS